VPILELLLTHPSVKLVGVVSVPDDPRNGTVPVALRAREAGLPLLQPGRLRDPGSLAEIEALEPELGVLADYGLLVPPAIIALPRHGILNVHPSLLPRHRGASPIPAAIAAGDAETGVTIISMDSGLDTGPIVAAERRRLTGSEAADGLEADLASDGARLLAATLSPWLSGDATPRAQDETQATLTRPLRREDGRLDPSRPAVELERQVRAMQPWPGTFLETGPGRIIVRRAESGVAASTDRPGTLVADDAGLALVTADGRLRLLEVQPAGGRSMSSAELLRGRPTLAGTAVAGPEPVAS
jgi:methionyl-tRNA formyltransferase